MLADGVEIDLITDLHGALELEAEWNALWDRCPDATAFQSAVWMLASWRHWEPLKRRMLFTARVHGDLTAVLLLRDCGDGSIELEGTETSDYLDVLIAPEGHARVLRALLEALDHVLDSHGQIRFERLRAGSVLLTSDMPQGWKARVQDQDVCPFITLKPGLRVIRAALPSGFFKQLDRARRVAARHFTVEVVDATASNATAHLQTLFNLHQTRWQPRAQAGVFAESAARQFQQSALPALVAQHRSLLLELRLDGVPAAALEALCGHKRALLYIAGFSLDFARFSPGRLLLGTLIERVIQEDYLEVDFLRGVEAYKYDWGAQNRTTQRVWVSRGHQSLTHDAELRPAPEYP